MRKINDASLVVVEERGEEEEGEEEVEVWWAVLRVPMRLGHVLSVDF